MENYSEVEKELKRLTKLLNFWAHEMKANNGQVSKKEWLSKQDVMTLLNVCSKTLYTYKKNGLIGYSKLSDKVILYSRESVKKLLESHYVEPKNQNT
jgi:hypothetical protein